MTAPRCSWASAPSRSAPPGSGAPRRQPLPGRRPCSGGPGAPSVAMSRRSTAWSTDTSTMVHIRPSLGMFQAAAAMAPGGTESGWVVTAALVRSREVGAERRRLASSGAGDSRPSGRCGRETGHLLPQVQRDAAQVHPGDRVAGDGRDARRDASTRRLDQPTVVGPPPLQVAGADHELIKGAARIEAPG